MSNKKQSSVEWLYTELTEILCDVEVNPVKAIAIFDRLKQAKEMHKDEQIDSIVQYQVKYYDIFTQQGIVNTVKKAEQFYNETFGGNNEQSK